MHSIGAVSGAGNDYTVAVLSRGHPSLEEGIDVVERIARAVNEGLFGPPEVPLRSEPCE